MLAFFVNLIVINL